MKNKTIINIIDYYNEADTAFLFEFLRGHLYLEYILNILIEKSIKDKQKNEFDTFNKKIKVLKESNIIDGNMKELLSGINRIRNKLAHQIDFEINFEMMFTLVRISSRAGVEYSDDHIYTNEQYSKECYGIDGIIKELFPNTFCQLLYNNERYFGDKEIYTYIC